MSLVWTYFCTADLFTHQPVWQLHALLMSWVVFQGRHFNLVGIWPSKCKASLLICTLRRAPPKAFLPCVRTTSFAHVPRTKPFVATFKFCFFFNHISFPIANPFSNCFKEYTDFKNKLCATSDATFLNQATVTLEQESPNWLNNHRLVTPNMNFEKIIKDILPSRKR